MQYPLSKTSFTPNININLIIDQHSANYDTGSGIPVEDENPSAFCPATDNAETNAGANPNDFGSEQQDGIFPSEPIKLEERESNISANAGSVQDLIKGIYFYYKAVCESVTSDTQP